jgi:hypothetical protein
MAFSAHQKKIFEGALIETICLCYFFGAIKSGWSELLFIHLILRRCSIDTQHNGGILFCGDLHNNFKFKGTPSSPQTIQDD